MYQVRWVLSVIFLLHSYGGNLWVSHFSVIRAVTSLVEPLELHNSSGYLQRDLSEVSGMTW